MLVNGAYVVNPQFEWTGGGLATTAMDLARWAKAVGLLGRRKGAATPRFR
jgi:hypothetical protein